MLRGEEGLNPGLFSPGTGPLFLFPAAVPVFPHSLSGHTGDTQGLTQGKQKAQTGQGHKDGTYAEHSGAGRPHAGRRTGQKHYGESRGEKVQGREGGETGDLTAGVFLLHSPPADSPDLGGHAEEIHDHKGRHNTDHADFQEGPVKIQSVENGQQPESDGKKDGETEVEETHGA